MFLRSIPALRKSAEPRWRRVGQPVRVNGMEGGSRHHGIEDNEGFTGSYPAGGGVSGLYLRDNEKPAAEGRRREDFLPGGKQRPQQE